MPKSQAQVIQLFDSHSSTYTYLVFDPDSLDAVIIDPVDNQIERDQKLIQDKGLKVNWALETHAHADHITSAGLLAEHLGLKTAAPEGCHIGTASVQLVDGQMISFGAFALKALHTPGHTAGSMSFYVAANEGGHVFTGDTLLIGVAAAQTFSRAALKRFITASPRSCSNYLRALRCGRAMIIKAERIQALVMRSKTMCVLRVKPKRSLLQP